MRLLKLFSKESSKRDQIERWVRTYSNELFKFAILRVSNREEAEDLVQVTFLKAYSSFDSFAADSNEKAWLYSILHNSIKDHMAKSARRPIIVDLPDLNDLEILADAGENPEYLLSLKMDLQELEKALTALPEVFAAPLLMHEIGNMKYEEISKTLAIPIGTVMSRLHRARKALLEMMSPSLCDVSEQKSKMKGGEADGLH